MPDTSNVYVLSRSERLARNAPHHAHFYEDALKDLFAEKDPPKFLDLCALLVSTKIHGNPYLRDLIWCIGYRYFGGSKSIWTPEQRKGVQAAVDSIVV